MTVKLPIQSDWRSTLTGWGAELRNAVATLFSGLETSDPVGRIVLWTNETPPPGWLACDGSVIGKEKYRALYNVIGNRFGAETGTTFTLPDMRGVPPAGATITTPGFGIGDTTNIVGTAGVDDLQSMLLFLFIIRY